MDLGSKCRLDLARGSRKCYARVALRDAIDGKALLLKPILDFGEVLITQPEAAGVFLWRKPFVVRSGPERLLRLHQRIQLGFLRRGWLEIDRNAI